MSSCSRAAQAHICVVSERSAERAWLHRKESAAGRRGDRALVQRTESTGALQGTSPSSGRRDLSAAPVVAIQTLLDGWAVAQSTPR